MSVTTPHPPARPDDPADDERTLDERVAELEALIEEARQRARKRRRRNAGVALVALLAAGAGAYAGSDGVGVGAARSAGGDATPAAALERADAWSAPTGPPGFPAGIVLHPSRPGVLYLSVVSSGRVFRSTDGGRSWSSGRAVASRIDALTVDPRNGSILYAGTGDGVLRSTDGGRTWRKVGLAPPPAKLSHARIEGWVNSIAIDPSTTSIVYATTYWRGLYRSTDAGATWHAARRLPLTTATYIHAGPGILYTNVVSWGSRRAAIARSTDGGRPGRACSTGTGRSPSIRLARAQSGRSVSAACG